MLIPHRNCYISMSSNRSVLGILSQAHPDDRIRYCASRANFMSYLQTCDANT